MFSTELPQATLSYTLIPIKHISSDNKLGQSSTLSVGLMAHTHCTGPGSDEFLYDAMYCTHYTGTGTCT